MRRSRNLYRLWKRTLWVGLLVVTLLLVGMGRSPLFAADAPRSYPDLEFPPAPQVQIPEYDRFELDNGLVVYLMEDRELPLVSGNVLVHTGDRLEPADKVGLASLTATVMRTGGTESRSPDEINEFLEQRAASVEVGIGTTAGSAGFSALSEDVETVFPLFAEILRQPVFSPDKLDVAKTQMRGDIARRNDDPSDVAGREFYQLLYGEESPYARIPEYETLANIDREDLVEFHRQYFRPDRAILGITGDFDTAEMKKLVEDTFADWNVPGEPPPLDIPNATSERQGGLFFAELPQLTQSYVQMGHLGGQLDDPDYPALSVMNGVLNGFGGRLFNEIRSRQGLAYSVYGYWSPSYDYDGTFIAGGHTRSDATVPLVRSLLEEVDRIRSEPVSAEELQYAKDSVLNSFIFNFADPSRILSRLMRYEYFGYPEDFIFQYQEGVRNTTAEDVLRVAQEHLRPENIVTLVVGNPAEIQPPLSTLKPDASVTAIDISIPEPSS